MKNIQEEEARCARSGQDERDHGQVKSKFMAQKCQAAPFELVIWNCSERFDWVPAGWVLRVRGPWTGVVLMHVERPPLLLQRTEGEEPACWCQSGVQLAASTQHLQSTTQRDDATRAPGVLLCVEPNGSTHTPRPHIISNCRSGSVEAHR